MRVALCGMHVIKTLWPMEWMIRFSVFIFRPNMDNFKQQTGNIIKEVASCGAHGLLYVKLIFDLQPPRHLSNCLQWLPRVHVEECYGEQCRSHRNNHKTRNSITLCAAQTYQKEHLLWKRPLFRQGPGQMHEERVRIVFEGGQGEPWPTWSIPSIPSFWSNRQTPSICHSNPCKHTCAHMVWRQCWSHCHCTLSIPISLYICRLASPASFQLRKPKNQHPINSQKASQVLSLPNPQKHTVGSAARSSMQFVHLQKTCACPAGKLLRFKMGQDWWSTWYPKWGAHCWLHFGRPFLLGTANFEHHLRNLRSICQTHLVVKSVYTKKNVIGLQPDKPRKKDNSNHIHAFVCLRGWSCAMLPKCCLRSDLASSVKTTKIYKPVCTTNWHQGLDLTNADNPRIIAKKLGYFFR